MRSLRDQNDSYFSVISSRFCIILPSQIVDLDPKNEDKIWSGKFEPQSETYCLRTVRNVNKIRLCDPCMHCDNTFKDASFITRPIFFVRSRRIRVDRLSYESKTTDKRQQNDWRARKNLDGHVVYTYVGSIYFIWSIHSNIGLRAYCGSIIFVPCRCDYFDYGKRIISGQKWTL